VFAALLNLYPNPLAPLVLVLLTGAVGVFVFRPRFFVLACLFLRASLDITKDGGAIYLSESIQITAALLLSLLVVVLGIFHILAHRVRVWRIPLVPVLSVFLAVSLLNCLATEDLLSSLMEWMRFLSTFVLYILVSELVRTRDDAVRVASAIMLSALVPVAVGLYQILENAGQYITGFVRANGTFVHPNPFAFYLIIVLSLLLNFLFAGAANPFSRFRGRMALLALPAAVCLVFTYTRTAWIGIFILFFFIVVARDRRLLWGFGALGLVFFAAGPLRQRFSDLMTSFNSVTHRFYIWKSGLEKLPRYPVLGRGLASFELLDPYGEPAHNDALRILFELGIVGVLVYVALGVELTARLWRLFRRDLGPVGNALARAAVSSLAVFILASLTGNIFFRPALQWYFWALAALVFRMGSIAGAEAGGDE